MIVTPPNKLNVQLGNQQVALYSTMAAGSGYVPPAPPVINPPPQFCGPPWLFTPNQNAMPHIYTGGVVMAGGTLQNTNIFDRELSMLNYPYLGICNGYRENHPVEGANVTTANSNGYFAAMMQGSYVILTFNSQLAGISTTILRSPSSYNKKGQNLASAWINTRQINSKGGWWYINGMPVNASDSRDYIGKERYSVQGRFTWNVGGKIPPTYNFDTRND